jgi:pimeloyl-ACP methyl ester carboxylesterase
MATQSPTRIEPVSPEQLDDLRERLQRTRFPDAETCRTEGSDLDWSQGPPLSYVQDLVRYWSQAYDWRRLERELNAHGQALQTVGGVDIHYLHVRSEREDAYPLILTHGWPSSVVEPLQVIDALANPAAADDPAFHVVAPSLPGFGFSGKPTTIGWSVHRIADTWATLMTQLGYDKFLAAGGDWGGRVTELLGSRHPDRVRGMHTFTPYAVEPDDADRDLSPLEARYVANTRAFWRRGSGYSLQQSTRPQTVGYGLTDSPVAQLTWILDKFYAWTDCAGHPENAVSRDRILDTVTLYWLSRSGGSSARIYWENFPPERTAPITVPSAVTVFAKDIEKLPRRWVEARYRDLRYWSVTDSGGHFPMLEVPDLYTAEVRRAFAALHP